jgi:hypothetical protein
MAWLRIRSLIGPLAFTLTAAAVVGVACKPDKEAETGGYVQGSYGTAGTAGYAGYPAAVAGAGGQYMGAGGAAAGYPGMPAAGAGAGGMAAGGAPSASAGAGGMAQPIDAATATVLQPVLNQLAKSHTVAGAKPLGAPMVASFQTGQVLEGQIQLQPQKCYTVVATALPPITDIDAQIVLATPLPNLAPVLAIDSETGTTAVVGKKPNCYKWALPMSTPAKVVLKVNGGAGLAAAQVYEK